METINVKLGKLKINKDNPRTITKEKMDKLVNSILVFPKMLEIRPIVVDGNMTALGGNQRTEALKRISKMSDDYIQEKLSGISDYHRLTKEEQDTLIKFWKDWMKAKEVPIINAYNLTEEEKNQFIIKDNNSFGEWDFAELQEKWDTSTLEDWGVDFPTEWYSPEKEKKEVEEDEFTEEDAANVETRVKEGDIWKLGEHRLMCGDSTSIDNIQMMMNGENCDLWITDPPYNVGYGMENSEMMSKRKHRTDGKIVLNDKQEDNEFAIFLEKSYLSAESVMKCGASFYIFHADNEGYNFRGALRKTNTLELKQTLIWLKDSLCLGRQDYQWIHEPCLYGWKKGASHNWYNDRKQTTVIKFNRPKKSEEHPTMKPVGLFGYLIGNSSKKGDIVLDSFCGSGTTIIACEQLGRKARCMELDPRYCDVIIARWEKLTGKEAVKIYG